MKKKDLIFALEKVKPGLASKESIEQTTFFAFMEGRVLTYNDNISISHPVNLDIEGAVFAEELYNFLKKVKQEEIDLEVVENEIRIKAGRSKAGLIIQEEITLPLEEISEAIEWFDIPETLLVMIQRAMYSCNKSTANAIANAVHVHADGFVEGTDYFKITRCQLGEPLPVDTFLLPMAAAKEVIKLKPTQIAEGEGWIHFKTESDTVISCRVIEDKFPVTSPILNVQGANITFPDDVWEILEKASIFSAEAIENAATVEIELGNNKLTISSSSDTGWFSEDIRMRYKEDPVTFTVSPLLLKDILSETLECTISDSKMKFEGTDWIYVTVLKGK